MAYRSEMNRLVSWCSRNNLELNTLKTVKMRVDFRKDPAPFPPVIPCDTWVEQNISSPSKKAQQRLFC